MAVIATDTTRYSNVVKGEFWPEKGWGKEVATTALANFTVAKKAAGALPWVVLSAGTMPNGTTDVVGIVLMATEEDPAKKTVMTKGPAVVAKQSLVTFGGVTGPQLTAIYAELEKVGIQVNDQI